MHFTYNIYEFGRILYMFNLIQKMIVIILFSWFLWRIKRSTQNTTVQNKVSQIWLSQIGSDITFCAQNTFDKVKSFHIHCVVAADCC